MIVLRIAARLAIIALAIFIAGFASALTILFGLQHLYEVTLPGEGAPLDLVLNALLLAAAAGVAISQFSLGLVAAVILLCEFLSLRSWLIYVATGAISATIAVLSVEEFGIDAKTAQMANRDMLLFIAAGLVGGLVYWLIAGRRAGAAIAPRGKGAEERQASPR